MSDSMKYHNLDYREDSKIDPEQLDVEWVRHVSLEERYIEQVSEKKQDWIRCIETEKLAHETLKTVRSKLVQKCHDKPEKCIGKSKATGPEVEAYYRTHPDYLIKKRKWLKAEIRVLEAQEEYEMAQAMKDLIHFTRTKAIEQLVTLYGQGYFAGPEEPRNINNALFKREAIDRKQKLLSAEIGSNLTVRRNN